MINVAEPMTTATTSREKIQTKGFGYWFDIIAFLLILASIFVGASSWRVVFTSTDRLVFFALTLLGIGIGLVRSKWQSDQVQPRLGLMWLGFAASVTALLMGVLFSHPFLGCVAMSIAIAVWCSGRILGEPLSRGVSLGVAVLSPFALEAFVDRGYFQWLESLTLAITSLLADAVGQPHARSEELILFKQGIADQFASIGVWDSAVSLLGVSLFFTFAFRRGLVVATISVLFALAVWVACRSVGWLVLSSLSTRFGTWYEWSTNIEVVVFALAALWVFGLDQLFGEIFRPIPFERVDPEYPLLAYGWNWICSLPHVVLRIPKANRIALRWRTRVKKAGKNPSWRTDYDWFRFEVVDMVFKPIGIIGSYLDAARAWRFTRRWRVLLITFPLLLLVGAVYGNAGLTLFKRKDVQTPVYAAESIKLCSTESMEITCHKLQEPEFVRSTGLTTVQQLGGGEQDISATTQRYIELLCKRILLAEPSNQIAKYRLGLILTMRNQLDEAEVVMREIVNGRQGDFPQANSWLVKALSIQKGAGKEIAKDDLLGQLEAACKWKDVDFRLLFLYGRLLLESGDKSKAIDVTKQAVAKKPEFVIELARLYARTGDEIGRIAAANQAEDYYVSKINFPDEKEVDRLAVSEARVLANRLDKAAEVLSEGLSLKLGGEKTRRQLSEIQALIYRRSIRQLEDGKYELDLGLLETVAETDPENPTVSSEIARLLKYKVRPSQTLLDVLKKQIASGFTRVDALLMLGDVYYVNGNLKEAERYWGLAAEKDPNNHVVLNNLASCLIELSTSNTERALELVVRANSISPNNPDILDTWGGVLMIANRPKEAVNKLEQVIKQDQGRIDTRRKLKTVYQSLGMLEMAAMQAKMIQSMEEANTKDTAVKVLVPE